MAARVSDLVMPDPFPSEPAPPRPIIPVDDEDEDDPDTGMIKAVSKTDPLEGQRLAQQKLRATSQKMQRIARGMTPTKPPSAPPSKKSD
jgi:hypothetical protein